MVALRPRRGVMLAGAALLAASLVAPRAKAHAILVESSPPAGGRIAPGEATLALRFNSRIDAGRSRVTLAHGTEAPLILETEANDTADMLRAQVSLTSGDYAVAWQVLAVDGHITRGRFTFTVGGD